ncbi:MAG: putative lipopolysaccharide heptosyltransferase III [Verrucomicrobiota bacterium]
MEFDPPRRIGVFKFKHIGDVLLMTPALRELRRRFPEARLTAVVHAFAAPMLEGNPDVDDIITAGHLEGPTGKLQRLRSELSLVGRIRAQRFDLTLDFGTSERAIWCGLLSGARRRAGFLYHRWQPGAWQRRLMTHLYALPANWRFKQETHQVLKDLWLVRQLGKDRPEDGSEAPEVLSAEDTAENLPLVFQPSEADLDWAETFLRPHRPERVVIVHPVSRWMSKCWLPERLAKVIDWLQRERGSRVILTSSATAQEVNYLNAIEEHCATRPFLLPGTATLGQLGGLIRAADGFLGIDSAPMHMAAALGTPQVALFGVTRPEDWGPWSPRAQVLAHPLSPHDPRIKNYDKRGPHPSMELITVEEVRQALDEILPVAPKN